MITKLTVWMQKRIIKSISCAKLDKRFSSAEKELTTNCLKRQKENVHIQFLANINIEFTPSYGWGILFTRILKIQRKCRAGMYKTFFRDGQTARASSKLEPKMASFHSSAPAPKKNSRAKKLGSGSKIENQSQKARLWLQNKTNQSQKLGSGSRIFLRLDHQ